MKSKLCIVLSVLLAVSAPAIAQAGKTTVSSTTSTFYSPNTAGYAQAIAWLKDHSFDDQRQLFGDFDKLGVIKVVYRTAPSSKATMDIPGPPVPLPTSGNKGDTITVFFKDKKVDGVTLGEANYASIEHWLVAEPAIRRELAGVRVLSDRHRLAPRSDRQRPGASIHPVEVHLIHARDRDRQEISRGVPRNAARDRVLVIISADHGPVERVTHAAR